MTKAIIFDCFGVLLLDAHQSFLESYGNKREQLLELRAQADAGFLDRAELLEAFAQVTDQTAEEVDERLRTEHHLNHKLVTLIKQLKKDQYKLGMLSNLGRGWLDELLPFQEVRGLFDDIVVSGDVHMVKPQREIYLLACDRLFVEPEDTLFIDDIQANCTGAQDAGLNAIHYTEFDMFTTDFKKYIALK